MLLRKNLFSYSCRAREALSHTFSTKSLLHALWSLASAQDCCDFQTISLWPFEKLKYCALSSSGHRQVMNFVEKANGRIFLVLKHTFEPREKVEFIVEKSHFEILKLWKSELIENRFILFRFKISIDDFSAIKSSFYFGSKVCCGFTKNLPESFGIRSLAHLSAELQPARRSWSIKFLNTVY